MEALNEMQRSCVLSLCYTEDSAEKLISKKAMDNRNLEWLNEM